jgi:hypothetical protein
MAKYLIAFGLMTLACNFGCDRSENRPTPTNNSMPSANESTNSKTSPVSEPTTHDAKPRDLVSQSESAVAKDAYWELFKQRTQSYRFPNKEHAND